MKYVINIARIWQQPLPVRIVGSAAALSRNTTIFVEVFKKDNCCKYAEIHGQRNNQSHILNGYLRYLWNTVLNSKKSVQHLPKVIAVSSF